MHCQKRKWGGVEPAYKFTLYICVVARGSEFSSVVRPVPTLNYVVMLLSAEETELTKG